MPNIKITAKQIRFIFDSGKVWMIQPLHVNGGIPSELQGFYCVPLDEERRHSWGRLTGIQEKKILRQWVSLGFKQTA